MKMPLNPHTTYQNKHGRDYRVISISKLHKTAKWIGRVEKFCWKVRIGFLDDESRYDTYWNHHDKFIKIKPVE